MFAKLRTTFGAVLLVGASSLALAAAAPAQARSHSAAHGAHGISHGSAAHGFAGFHSFASDHIVGLSEPGLSASHFAAPDRATGHGVAHFTALNRARGSYVAHFVGSASAERGGFQHGLFGSRDFREHHDSGRHHYIGWAGPVFWPFAYADLINAMLPPYGDFGPGYSDFWGYGYSDLVGGALVPFGYTSEAAANQTPPRATTASPSISGGGSGMAVEPISAGATGASVGELCVSAQPIADALPVARLKDALQPDAEQSSELQVLTASEAAAAEALQASCATLTRGPATPVERLQTVERRLKSMLQAVDAVQGPLDAFYESLSEGQKARFDTLAPVLSPPRAEKGAAAPTANCAPEDEIPIVAVADIARAVFPSDEQRADLAALYRAASKADQAILATCPAVAPLTPTGRLAAIRERVSVMLQGVEDVRPALQRFWTSLDADQQSQFSAVMQPEAPNAQTSSVD